MATRADSVRLIGPRRLQLTRGDVRRGGWAVAALFGTLAVVGALTGNRLAVLGGAFVTVSLVGVLAPEFSLAAFMFSGVLKGAPFLSGVPIDPLLLTAAGIYAAIIVRAWRRGVPRLNPGLYFPFALSALMLLTVLWSRNPTGGNYKAIYFALFTTLAVTAPSMLLLTPQAIRRFAMAVLGLGCLVALTTKAGTATEPLKAAGGSGNEIEAGLFPAIGMMGAYGYLMLDRAYRLRWLWIVPGGICTVGVIAAGSRGALSGGVVAIAFLVFVHIRAARYRVRATVVAVALLGALVVIGPQFAGAAATSRYRDGILSAFTGGGSQAAVGERNYLWDRGITLALDHPFGVGVAGFEPGTAVGPPYSKPALYPHNIFIEVWCEEGMLGLAFLLATIGAAWLARRRTPGGGTRTPEAAFVAALIIVTLTEANLSFDVNGDRAAWIALGMALALPALHARRRLSAAAAA